MVSHSRFVTDNIYRIDAQYDYFSFFESWECEFTLIGAVIMTFASSLQLDLTPLSVRDA